MSPWRSFLAAACWGSDRLPAKCQQAQTLLAGKREDIVSPFTCSCLAPEAAWPHNVGKCCRASATGWCFSSPFARRWTYRSCRTLQGSSGPWPSSRPNGEMNDRLSPRRIVSKLRPHGFGESASTCSRFGTSGTSAFLSFPSDARPRFMAGWAIWRWALPAPGAICVARKNVPRGVLRGDGGAISERREV